MRRKGDLLEFGLRAVGHPGHQHSRRANGHTTEQKNGPPSPSLESKTRTQSQMGGIAIDVIRHILKAPLLTR
jgi:hypothetical protein